MVRKWFSVFIVCILLFVICGCRSAEESGATPKRQFQTMRAYAETMDGAVTQKAVEGIFDNRKIDPSLMVMLLEDDRFVLPILENAVVTSVVLDGAGHTDFMMELPHGCGMTVRAYHYVRTYDETAYSDFEKTAITIGTAGTLEGVRYRKETTQDGETTVQNRYILQRDGYPIEILADNSCECDANYVTQLSFRTGGGPSCIIPRYAYLDTTTKRTTTVSWEEPAFVGSYPPSITVDGIELRNRGTRRWTSRSPEGKLRTIIACGAKYWTNYDESDLILATEKDVSQTVTLSCEYPPLSVDVSCRSMAEGEQKHLEIPVTTGTDKDGNTVYTFPLKTDGFYGYGVSFFWERYGETNSAMYCFYSNCDA